MDELKKLLLQMDTDMAQRQQAASPAHRGMLLANFIQNLAEILSRVAPTQRKLFAQKLMSVLDTMEPQVRIQILGAPPASVLKEQTGDVIHETLEAMSDSQFLGLLGDAMEQTGAKSACSGNLFNRALARFKGPAPLLKSIRQEMHRAIQEGNSGVLGHWQQIEQLLISQQEAEEFNEQYRKEIEALATSLNMKAPMVEEEEMARLLKTLTPESLRPARAHLIIDLISQPRTAQTENLVRSLLEGLGGIVRHFLSQGQFLTVGNLLRKLMVALSDYPEDGPVRETVSSLLTAEDIKAVMENLLKRCRTYEPRETARIAAICRLYPEKSVDSLLDSLLELGNEDSLQSRWLSTSLAALGQSLSRALNRRLLDAPDMPSHGS
jgi:hypothetical protein